MLGPAWVVLERRLRAAEDLGIKLTAAEKKTRENIWSNDVFSFNHTLYALYIKLKLKRHYFIFLL